MNNFCISVPSNEPRSITCPIEYGWEDKIFADANAQNIDCLLCHDRRHTYQKFLTIIGHPIYKGTKLKVRLFKATDLIDVAILLLEGLKRIRLKYASIR